MPELQKNSNEITIGLTHEASRKAPTLPLKSPIWWLKTRENAHALHYAVQGKVTDFGTNRNNTTTCQWLILTDLLSCTVSKLWLIIGQIFASERGAPHFNALVSGDLLPISP